MDHDESQRDDFEEVAPGARRGCVLDKTVMAAAIGGVDLVILLIGNQYPIHTGNAANRADAGRAIIPYAAPACCS